VAQSRRREFSKKESEGIIQLAKEEEGDARTVWQLVKGGTALARSIPHADLRVSFERRVSGLLRAASGLHSPTGPSRKRGEFFGIIDCCITIDYRQR
jgi:hypothetical protein